MPSQKWEQRRGITSLGFEEARLRVATLSIGALLASAWQHAIHRLPAMTPDILFTTSIAFAASVQIQTFREVNGHSDNSTFMTGNLRTLAKAAAGWLQKGHKQAEAQVVRDFSVISAAFLAGATAGAYGVQMLGNRALLVRYPREGTGNRTEGARS